MEVQHRIEEQISRHATALKQQVPTYLLVHENANCSIVHGSKIKALSEYSDLVCFDECCLVHSLDQHLEGTMGVDLSQPCRSLHVHFVDER